MEQILNKLSEIEITAQRIKADPKPPFRQKWNSSAGTLTQNWNRKPTVKYRS